MNKRNSLIKKSRLPKDAPATDRWVGRLAAVAHEGKQQLGAGVVMQTRDTMAYITSAELALIAPDLVGLAAVLLLGCQPNQFVAMITRDDATALTIVDAPRPLAEMRQRWGKTVSRGCSM